MKPENADLIRELAREQARREVPELRTQIAELTLRLRQILKTFPSLSRANGPKMRKRTGGKETPMPVGHIAERFRREQARHGRQPAGKKKVGRTPGQKRQAQRMRELHADPAWRKKHGYPPPQ